MSAPDLRLDRLVEDSLHFERLDGMVTSLPGPYRTGWRQLPYAIFAHSDGAPVRVRLSPTGGLGYTVTAGQGLLIPTGVGHDIDKESGRPSASRWVHFRITVLQTVDLFTLLVPPQALAQAEAVRLGDLCAELAERSAPLDPLAFGPLLERKQLGLRFVEGVLRVCTPRPGAGRSLLAAQRLAPALQAMRDELAGALSLERLAARCGLSPSRLHAIFREALGVPPMQYLQRLRLERARSLLLAGDLPVAEIAEHCGFADPFHFSRLFKARCGCSPLRYREGVRLGLWKPSGP